jgi:hypothetical protein
MPDRIETTNHTFTAISNPQQVKESADFQGFVCNDDRNHAGGVRLLLTAMVVKYNVQWQAFILLRCYVTRVSGWLLAFRAAFRAAVRR